MPASESFDCIDISDYQVEDCEQYTHIVSLAPSKEIRVHFENEHFAELSKFTSDPRPEFYILEKLGDQHIPYICFDGDHSTYSRLFYATIKTLYNCTKAVVVLDNPYKAETSSPSIVCAPLVRVDPQAQKEIFKTFESLCRMSGVDYKESHITHLPLNWPYSLYREDVKVDTDEYEENIPTLLSCMLTSYPITKKNKLTASQAKKMALVTSVLIHNRGDIRNDKSKAKELVKLLNKNRSRDRSMFYIIGRCLRNIYGARDEDAEQAKKLWIECSLPELHDDCDIEYDLMETTGTYYGIRTLQHWAKMDSPKEYVKWNHTSVNIGLEASVLPDGGDLDIADVAYRLDPTRFVTSGDSHNECVFYEFNGTYYKQVGTFRVQDYLQYQVIPEYKNFCKDLCKDADNNPDNNIKDIIQAKIDKCRAIIVSLKSDAGMRRIFSVLMRIYNRENFEDIRDSNPYLTVFEDCIFDAEKRIIRDGIPEDYCTISTGYKFKEAYNEITAYKCPNGGTSGGWDHPHVKIVVSNIEKIVHDKEKREFLRREFASRLHASNPNKRMILMHGPTNNGKSALIYYLMKALGMHYAPDLHNNTLFAKDSDPTAPTSHLAPIRYSRALVQTEITDEHILNESLAKRLTGCTDKITYRIHFEKKIKSFIPKCIPFCVCNTFPKLNGNSAAMKTRLMVLELDSSFILESDPEYAEIKAMSPADAAAYMEKNHIFYADPNFADIIDETYQAFMWVMINDYMQAVKNTDNKDGKGRAIVSPAKVPKSIAFPTAVFFSRANIYYQFWLACTEKVPNAPGCSVYELYNTYKLWYTNNVGRYGIVPHAKFIGELESMKLKSHNEVYREIVIKYRA